MFTNFCVSPKEDAWGTTLSECLSFTKQQALQEEVNALLMQVGHEAIVQLIDATQANETHQV